MTAAASAAPERLHTAEAARERENGVQAGSAPVGVAVATAYIPELESLRGIAMLLVLSFHLDSFVRGPFLKTDSLTVSPALAFVRAGHSGVDLFFILSAFLLSIPVSPPSERREARLRPSLLRTPRAAYPAPVLCGSHRQHGVVGQGYR
jgi:peptidoglycan/LPS O-acetylase OafA/YrhL